MKLSDAEKEYIKHDIKVTKKLLRKRKKFNIYEFVSKVSKWIHRTN